MVRRSARSAAGGAGGGGAGGDDADDHDGDDDNRDDDNDDDTNEVEDATAADRRPAVAQVSETEQREPPPPPPPVQGVSSSAGSSRGSAGVPSSGGRSGVPSSTGTRPADFWSAHWQSTAEVVARDLAGTPYGVMRQVLTDNAPVLGSEFLEFPWSEKDITQRTAAFQRWHRTRGTVDAPLDDYLGYEARLIPTKNEERDKRADVWAVADELDARSVRAAEFPAKARHTAAAQTLLNGLHVNEVFADDESSHLLAQWMRVRASDDHVRAFLSARAQVLEPDDGDSGFVPIIEFGCGFRSPPIGNELRKIVSSSDTAQDGTYRNEYDGHVRRVYEQRRIIQDLAALRPTDVGSDSYRVWTAAMQRSITQMGRDYADAMRAHGRRQRAVLAAIDRRYELTASESQRLQERLADEMATHIVQTVWKGCAEPGDGPGRRCLPGRFVDPDELFSRKLHTRKKGVLWTLFKGAGKENWRFKSIRAGSLLSDSQARMQADAQHKQHGAGAAGGAVSRAAAADASAVPAKATTTTTAKQAPAAANAGGAHAANTGDGKSSPDTAPERAGAKHWRQRRRASKHN